MKEKVYYVIILTCSISLIFSWYFVFFNVEKVNDNEGIRLWCFAPSVVDINEEFEIDIQAWDKWEYLAMKYDGEIVLKDYIINNPSEGTLKENIETNSYQFPKDISFQPYLTERTYFAPEYYLDLGTDAGNIKLSGLTLGVAGIHYIKVASSDGLFTFSNPILVEQDPEYHLYFGDIHGHTDYSDGSGTPEFAYKYARDVACLDFASVTDHDYALATIHPEGYQAIKAATNRYHSNGDFVTIFGYEWTKGFNYGHLNVYFKGDYGAFYPCTSPEYGDALKFLSALHEWNVNNPDKDLIAIPHHVTSSQNYFDWSYDWRDMDPDLVPLVEIYSCHGSGEISEEEGNTKALSYGKGAYYEFTEGYNVQSALSMGYRLGIMGGSDTHDARLGHPLLHTDNYGTTHPFATLDPFRSFLPMPGGLTACWAENLSRENIFDNMKSRRLYATTHVSRPLVTFSVNGISPGMESSVVMLDGQDVKRTIKATVAIDANYENNYIKTIEIVKNNEIWAIYNTTGLYLHDGTKIQENYQQEKQYMEFTLFDDDPITGMTYDGGEFIEGKGYKITEGADRYLDEQPSTNGADFYYLRVTDSFTASGWDWTPSWEGNQAWVGPIWVECK